ncbi:aerotolerance-related exported protein [Flavobacteria bacterium BAL38]|nr:aerotolerance-related exported protein [Flavobacteria bacterium BAL38]
MKKNMHKIVYLVVLLVSGMLFSQESDKNLYNGNQSFEQKKYTDAEADYRVTESKKSPKKATAGYNLGNSIYRQNQQGEAQIKYIQALETAKTKTEKHRIYHNLGNTFMLDKNYDAAVDAYKNALRNNPFDEETRYNYALAKRKKKENPPPKGGDNDKNKGGNDKKPQPENNKNDKGNSDKDNKKDQNKDKDKGDGEKKEDEKENPKPSGADKQRIDNILDAVNNAEKKVQDKVNAKKVKARPVSNEKDW